MLSAVEASAQATTSSAAVTSLRDDHAVVVRNTTVPHSLRSNPTQNADPTTSSRPLRIWTHLFHELADVDNLVAKLQSVVPMPSAPRRRATRMIEQGRHGAQPTTTEEQELKSSRTVVAATVLTATLLGGCAVSEKMIHTTDKVYPAIGPYSQMVQSGNTYYLSGVIPLNMAGNAVQGTTIEEQTRLVLDYIGAVLKAQGMSYSNVVMSNVYMKDLGEFAKMNAIYGEYFKTSPPSRATVEVARLPRDVRIEISVIAAK